MLDCFLHQVMAADSSLSWGEVTETMKTMCTASWDDDKAVVSWIQSSQVRANMSS